jgi:hypothetical protein
VRAGQTLTVAVIVTVTGRLEVILSAIRYELSGRLSVHSRTITPSPGPGRLEPDRRQSSNSDNSNSEGGGKTTRRRREDEEAKRER